MNASNKFRTIASQHKQRISLLRSREGIGVQNLKLALGLFLVFQMLSMPLVLGQDTLPNKKCWRGICKVYSADYSEYYVTDSLGNILIPSGYQDIQFTDLRNFIQVKNKDGLKGIISLTNKTIVPIEFKDARIHQGFIKTASTTGLTSLYDTLGHIILPPDIWQIKFELIPDTYVFAKRDSLYYIFNKNGKQLFDFGIKEYAKFRYMGEGGFKITLLNGNECLFGTPEFSERMSKEYKRIETAKNNTSVTILTWLPDNHGIVLKQCARAGLGITEPIYMDICFDPGCVEQYKDKIRYEEVKPPKLFYAVGILPDGSMHIFSSIRSEVLTIAKP